MHEHTFHYEDEDDLIQQMQSLMVKLLPPPLEDYLVVRARYNLKPAAFTNRLKRFKGTFPKVMGGKGKNILKLGVTPELHRALS